MSSPCCLAMWDSCFARCVGVLRLLRLGCSLIRLCGDGGSRCRTSIAKQGSNAKEPSDRPYCVGSASQKLPILIAQETGYYL